MCTTQYFRENRSSLQQLNIVRLARICDGPVTCPTGTSPLVASCYGAFPGSAIPTSCDCSLTTVQVEAQSPEQAIVGVQGVVQLYRTPGVTQAAAEKLLKEVIRAVGGVR